MQTPMSKAKLEELLNQSKEMKKLASQLESGMDHLVWDKDWQEFANDCSFDI